jgi:hypothetical protein
MIKYKIGDLIKFEKGYRIFTGKIHSMNKNICVVDNILNYPGKTWIEYKDIFEVMK